MSVVSISVGSIFDIVEYVLGVPLSWGLVLSLSLESSVTWTFLVSVGMCVLLFLFEVLRMLRTVLLFVDVDVIVIGADNMFPAWRFSGR